MEKDFEKVIHDYEYALEMIKVELGILINEYADKHKYNPVEYIKTRIKSKDSINNKLIKKGYEITVENIIKHIHDIIGVRIVCSFLSDVYDVVELIKHFEQITIIEEKNYITNPKNSGYTSYHLIVKIPIYLSEGMKNIEAEIQIRTIAMDFWASLDHKIQYKFSQAIPENIKKEMYNCAIDIKNLDNKMLELNRIVKEYKN